MTDEMLMEQFEKMNKTINENISKVEETINNKISKVEETINKKISKVEETINEKFGKIEEKIEYLSYKVDRNKEAIDRIDFETKGLKLELRRQEKLIHDELDTVVEVLTQKQIIPR